MPKALFAGCAAAAVILSLPGTAGAMRLASPRALAVPARGETLVQTARAVCGATGCVAVHVSPPRKHTHARRMPPWVATRRPL